MDAESRAKTVALGGGLQLSTSIYAICATEICRLLSADVSASICCIPPLLMFRKLQLIASAVLATVTMPLSGGPLPSAVRS